MGEICINGKGKRGPVTMDAISNHEHTAFHLQSRSVGKFVASAIRPQLTTRAHSFEEMRTDKLQFESEAVVAPHVHRTARAAFNNLGSHCCCPKQITGPFECGI